jgi:hypothetical protein
MHTLSRLQGHGAIVLPEAPYRIERAADAPETTLRIWHAERSAMLDVRDVLRGAEASEVAEVKPGDPTPAWRIETSVLSCAWPRGFALSSDPDELSPFLLIGPNDAMIWIAGPIERAKATPIERLATEEQTIRAVAEAGDNARIDVDYEHDDERWWQRRYVLGWGDDQVLIVTAQARSTDEVETCAAVDAIEASIVPAVSA